jgi:hypothetical protein
LIAAFYLWGLNRRTIVDLNYLFHRQQVERTRAEGAETDAARAVHEELAKQYEERIEELTANGFHFRKAE